MKNLTKKLQALHNWQELLLHLGKGCIVVGEIVVQRFVNFLKMIAWIPVQEYFE